MEVNDIQIGGNHYKKMDYQPWDLICDLKLHFLPASLVRYLARWRSKNGAQDLRKALHFIDKCIERNVETRDLTNPERRKLDKFLEQLTPCDEQLIRLVIDNNYDIATKLLNTLISDLELDGKLCTLVQNEEDE